jgi:hypothetical protein
MAISYPQPITICFKTCFDHFSREFSDYFPKNSSRKLHLEHSRDIIDGCRFGWVEIAFMDAIISCCLNCDLKIGKRNFHQHIALVKAIQYAIVRDSLSREYHSLCKYHNATHDIWLINILAGFESAKALADHVIAGKDNSRAEKKAKNLNHFFSLIASLSINQDSVSYTSMHKASNLDELAIVLDKRPALKYLSALSIALRNATTKIPQLELVEHNNLIKAVVKERKDSLNAEVNGSVLLLQAAASAIEDTGDNYNLNSLSAYPVPVHDVILGDANHLHVDGLASFRIPPLQEEVIPGTWLQAAVTSSNSNSPDHFSLAMARPQARDEHITDYAAALMSMSQSAKSSPTTRKRSHEQGSSLHSMPKSLKSLKQGSEDPFAEQV